MKKNQQKILIILAIQIFNYTLVDQCFKILNF